MVVIGFTWGASEVTINVQIGQMIADMTVTAQYIVISVKKSMEKRILHVMAGMSDYSS